MSAGMVMPMCIRLTDHELIMVASRHYTFVTNYVCLFVCDCFVELLLIVEIL